MAPSYSQTSLKTARLRGANVGESLEYNDQKSECAVSLVLGREYDGLGVLGDLLKSASQVLRSEEQNTVLLAQVGGNFSLASQVIARSLYSSLVWM